MITLQTLSDMWDALHRAYSQLRTDPRFVRWVDEVQYRRTAAGRVRALFCRSTLAEFDEGSSTATSDDEDPPT